MPLDWNESFAKAHRANIDPQPRMHPDARSADEGAGGLAAADTASSPATSIDKSGEQLVNNRCQQLLGYGAWPASARRRNTSAA